MVGGAIINATAFVGGSYLAKYLSGKSNADNWLIKKKKRHDLAVEKYQAAYEKYEENRTKLIDWIATNDRIKSEAKTFFTNTDYALKLYNKVHLAKALDQIDLKEPEFSDFYQPSNRQKQGELIYVGVGALAIGFTVLDYFNNKLISFSFLNNKMRNLSKIYYSPGDFWKGLYAVKTLAEAAGVSEDEAKLWLMKQAIWQIYLLAPKYIPRPTFDVESPNSIHQADLLFLPHDKIGRKVYKYALLSIYEAK